MRKSFKKTAACVTALSAVFALSGCGDNGYIMTIEGMDIRNGVYISFIQSALGDADQKLNELESAETSSAEASSNETSSVETSSDDTTSDETGSGETDSSESTESTESSENSFDKTIEGKSYSDWVKEDALRAAKRFTVIFKTAEEKGIELSDEEIQQINDQVNSDWDTSNDYAMYLYGVNTIGEFYEAQGIGKDSMRDVSKANLLNSKLFDYYYGEGGEKQVPDEEFESYAEENYSACRVLRLPLTDYKGDELESDADKQAVRDKAKAYAERVNNGEKMIDIKYDADLESARNTARTNAETGYDEDSSVADGLSRDDYIKKAVDEATATKADSDETLDEVVSKTSTRYSAEMIDYILSAEPGDKAFVYDDEKASFVIVKHSVFTLENWGDSNYSSVIHEMKNDEFNEMMESFYADYTVVSNNNLINKYSPEKIYGKQQELLEKAKDNNSQF